MSKGRNMAIYVITAIYFCFFIYNFTKNRSKISNGFLAAILFLFVMISLTKLQVDTGSEVLYGIIVVIAAIVAMSLLMGTFVIIVASIGSGILLLKREGRSLSNMLSLAFGLGIIGVFALSTVRYESKAMTQAHIYFMIIVNSLFFYFIFMFSSFLVSAFLYRIYYPLKTPDYIVVLGAGLIDGDKVTPLLGGRIDRAIKVYNRRKKKPMLLMSGGQGSDEMVPESVAMKNYAIEKGIPDCHIITEEKSKNTYENMMFSKEIIEANEGKDKKLKILFSTTNYHVFRSSMYARMVGLKAQGIGSQTKYYFWFNATLREFIAVIFMNKKFHAISASLTVAMALMLYFLFERDGISMVLRAFGY